MGAIHQAMLMVGSVVGATTWDPATLGNGVVLSNGNLTAESASPGQYANARSTISKSAGKWYFEVVLDIIGSDFQPGVGVADYLPSSSDQELGANPTGSYSLRANGDTFMLGVLAACTTQLVVGDTVMVAFDMTAGKIWFGKNGTWLLSGDPAAGTGETSSGLTGSMRAAMSCGPAGSEGKGTAKFSGFTYAPPSGFSALA